MPHNFSQAICFYHQLHTDDAMKLSKNACYQNFCLLGLLETPSLPPQLSVETASFKIILTGKPGVGKTSTVAKLLGQGESSTFGVS